MKKEIKEVQGVLSGLFTVPHPSLGLDIDGVLDEANLFFRTLSHVWPGQVFIISYRNNREKAVQDLEKLGIRYDELILVSSFEQKAEVIVEKGILIFFDDQPECLKHVSEDRHVMLVRNGGNFDFDDKRWMLSDQTGKLV
jgi:hypothetical protein